MTEKHYQTDNNLIYLFKSLERIIVVNILNFLYDSFLFYSILFFHRLFILQFNLIVIEISTRENLLKNENTADSHRANEWEEEHFHTDHSAKIEKFALI